MYRDNPKSPSFTQSTVDTNTFRAAMSLWWTKANETKSWTLILIIYSFIL